MTVQTENVDGLGRAAASVDLPGWSNRQVGYALGTGIAVSVAILVFRAETLSLDRALLALSIIWIGVLPGLFYLRQPAKARAPFPLMPLTGIFYSVFFGMPAFWASYTMRPDETRMEFYGEVFIDAISTKALILTIVSVGLMFLSWTFSKAWLFQKLPRLSVSKKVVVNNQAVLAWGLALGSFAYIIFPEVRALPSVGQFLQPAGYVAFAIFYILLCQRQLSRPHLFAYFFILLPVWLGNLVATGSLTGPFMLGVLWVALRLSMRGTLPWKLIFAAPVILVLLYPAVAEFRNQFWGRNNDATVLTKLKGFSEAVIERNSQLTIDPNLYVRLVRRISLIYNFSHVVEQTPDNVPYWNGATYQTLFVGWVPRFIWTSKPKESWGNVFGRRYGIVPENDRNMSLNIPWVIEMYANFGAAAVVIGMALVGVFFGGLERILNSPSARSMEQGIGSAVLLPLFYQESNFTLMTGSLLPLIICLWIYFVVGQRFLRLKI